MSDADPQAKGNDSRGIATLLRASLAVAGVAGAVLLVLATSATVIRIKVLTTGATASGLDTTVSGSDRHGAALVVIAIFAAVMLLGALRGARPAMLAVAAAGVLALAIAIIGDARHIHDTGEVGRLYEAASAGAGPGFHYETLGGALLLIAGGGLLFLSGGGNGGGGTRVPAMPEDPEPETSTEPDDWFAAT